VLWPRKSTAIPLLHLWAVRPVQSLSACTRVHFTFTFTFQLHCGTHSSFCGVIVILSSTNGRDIPVGLKSVCKGLVHKNFVPEEKTVNAEFYKGVMDRRLKRNQRFRPATFCSQNFFLLHDNAPTHKAANVCQFLTPQKSYNPLTPPPSPILFRFISARLFLVPQVKNGVKRTPFC